MTMPSNATNLVDGRENMTGIRNNVLVMPSVICSHIVADQIADAVPSAVSTPHDHGCAQIGSDETITRRTLINVGLNPNVAGAVIVGLGCETVQSNGIVSGMQEGGLPVESVVIQEIGGTDDCIAAGIEYAKGLVQQRGEAGSESVTLGDLTIGIVSSDVRDSTRESAEPLACDLIDQVVDAGGRVVMAGKERFLTDKTVLAERTATPTVADSVREHVAANAGHFSRMRPASRDAVSLDSDEKLDIIGEHEIATILDYGERATHDQGIAIVDAAMQFGEAATALSAAGAQLIVHLTADGIPTGHPVVPVLKITGEEQTAAAMGADIDIDARNTTVDTLRETVLAVANGHPTCAEQHGVSQFSITRFGPSM